MPEDEEVKRGKWTFAHLPAIPPQFALKPIEKNEARLKTLLQLIKRKDVARLINACDAGREGELIFRYIVAVREGRQADPAAVAAVDDAGVDPRRLRAPAQRRGDAAARRRRRVPLRIRLARRHQRHARDDRVQLQVRRLPADDRRPRADAHARDPGRARGEDPRVRAAQLLGGARRRSAREAGEYTGRWFDENFAARRRDRAAATQRRSRSPCPSGCGTKRRATRIARCLRRQAGHRHRGGEADDADRAAALRPHQPAARGQRPLRLLGAHDARRSRRRSTKSTRRSPIRAPIRARCPRTISTRSRRRSSELAETGAYGTLRAQHPEEQVGAARTSASSTTRRSPTTSRSSRRSCGRST